MGGCRSAEVCDRPTELSVLHHSPECRAQATQLCDFFQAFHLIKAVSVLLNFSQEEENMLKETLEYKVRVLCHM